METVDLPISEPQRLEALRSYHILDTSPDRHFEDVIKLASKICDAPISHIGLMDSNRQWLMVKLGIVDSEVPRNLTICTHAILHPNQPLIVADASQDQRFNNNPSVLGEPNIRFYAGFPLLTPEGHAIGTLCVIDKKPRELTDDQQEALKTLAHQVVTQLELRKKVIKLEEASKTIKIHQEKLTNIILSKDKLLSIIAHDMRGPISNLLMTIDMLDSNDITPEEAIQLITLAGAHVKSCDNLLNSLMHWARIQMDSFTSEIRPINPYHVAKDASETIFIASQSKDNKILIKIPVELSIEADIDALGFVFRNLIGNANKFTQQGTITIAYQEHVHEHVFSVHDTGQGMNEQKLEILFNWDKQKSTKGTSGEIGTGLGLTICKELIEKQNGNIYAESTVGIGTTISFTLPKSN